MNSPPLGQAGPSLFCSSANTPFVADPYAHDACRKAASSLSRALRLVTETEHSLTGKAALVTGGGGGIGRAIATALAQADARVIVTDVDPEAEAVAAECGCIFLQADLASQTDTVRLAAEALALYGPVDILVNNAGLQHVDPVEDFPDDMWHRIVQVMLNAPFLLTKRLLPGMRERGWGRVINIASAHSLVASPFKSAYISAKHGLLGFTRTAALETAQDGITVNAICPGYVNTPLVGNQITAQARTLGIPESEVIEKVMLAPSGIQRMLEPEEVASMALYLASRSADMVTGAALSIDGGWTAR